MKRYFFILNLLTPLLSAPILGAQIENITFPELLNVARHPLKLNGLALRKATIFKVNVYAAGLYLMEKSSSTDLILSSNSPKVLIMKFMRDVSQEQINEAWDKSFEDIQSQYSQEIKQLKKLTPNAKEGDSLEYIFTEDKTEFKLNQTLKGTMPGGKWGKALLATWLGKNPPTEELKKGLLGIKE